MKLVLDHKKVYTRIFSKLLPFLAMSCLHISGLNIIPVEQGTPEFRQRHTQLHLLDTFKKVSDDLGIGMNFGPRCFHCSRECLTISIKVPLIMMNFTLWIRLSPRPGFVPKFVRSPTISPVRQVVTCAPEDFSEQRVKKIILSRKSVVVDPPI